jgi:hypothetical protein
MNDSICKYSRNTRQRCYLENVIEKLVFDFKQTTSICEKALFLKKIVDWISLLFKMDLSTQETISILKGAHCHIEMMTSYTDELTEHFHPGTIIESSESHVNGDLRVVYHNVYESIYALEELSFKKHGIFVRKQLTQTTFQQLDFNINYNFVVLAEGEVFFSESQEYDSLKDQDLNNIKILLAPNHSLLAEGKPVLTAGEFTLLGNNKRHVWIVGTTSGHYRPPLESKRHLIRALTQLGIAKEQIVTTDFHVRNIPWKFVEKESQNQ